MRISTAIGIAAIAAVVGVAVGQQATQPAPETVRMITLPLELPAVGNLDAVDAWRFGRIEGVEQRGSSPDVTIRIRTADDVVHEVVGPTEPLIDLARASRWTDADSRTVAGRKSYVERMIAFDVDDEGRLIAAISLEPMNRSRSRLARAMRR